MDHAQIITAANAALARAGIKEPPVDPQVVAEAYNIRTVFCDFQQEPEPLHLTVAGFFDEERQTIFINRDLEAMQRSHVIACEIGKRMLHPGWTQGPHYKISRMDGVKSCSKEMDAEAFARNLCAPAWMVRQLLHSIGLDEMSKLFCYPADKIVSQIDTMLPELNAPASTGRVIDFQVA